MSSHYLKRGTAVLWKTQIENTPRVTFGVVRSVQDDLIEIELIEPQEQDTIIVNVPCTELEPL